MFEHDIYRKKLGLPLKTCMVCDSRLTAGQSQEFGLCPRHRNQLLSSPPQIMRDFGKGREFQTFRHTDELDDILYRLEHGREPFASPDDVRPDEWNWPANPQYLIYAHYIAKLFLRYMPAPIELSAFDYITFVDSCYVSMELIFSEMGYLAKGKRCSRLFLTDELHYLMQENYLLPIVAGKRVLLLDLYRSYDTRSSIDRLKLSGAREIVTVYLTSYS